eukprot:4428477-Lingulodinium_polyedra.AAC.1
MDQGQHAIPQARTIGLGAGSAARRCGLPPPRGPRRFAALAKAEQVSHPTMLCGCQRSCQLSGRPPQPGAIQQGASRCCVQLAHPVLLGQLGARQEAADLRPALPRCPRAMGHHGAGAPGFVQPNAQHHQELHLLEVEARLG